MSQSAIRTSSMSRPVKISSKRKTIRLRDKINQNVCTKSVDDLHNTDVSNVYSNSNGILSGKAVTKSGKKVNVTFDVRIGAWVY